MSQQGDAPSGKAPQAVYGPIDSWRFGRSLGIDLLLHGSLCSFQCIYCQLGRIQTVTRTPGIFVETARIRRELDAVDWEEVDVATFSGSGEPTLALNLGEAIREVREKSRKPVIVLSNGAQFSDPAVRERVIEADRVVCKLDAATQEMLERFNHPAPGIRIDDIAEGLVRLRGEYTGILGLQCMFMPVNLGEAEGIARIAARINPDEIQLNVPRRPHPGRWVLTSRGSRTPEPVVLEGAALPIPTGEEMNRVESIFRREAPGVRILRRETGSDY